MLFLLQPKKVKKDLHRGSVNYTFPDGLFNQCSKSILKPMDAGSYATMA